MTLRVASFNLCNLSPVSRDERFRRLADTIVRGLSSPALVAVQELAAEAPRKAIYSVPAEATYEKLNSAIVSLGGPHYEFAEIPPLLDGDGGERGRNIRVAYLFDPNRAVMLRRGRAGPEDAVSAHRVDGRLYLSASPARLAPEDPAFRGDASLAWPPSRKALAAEFRVGANTLIMINCHFKSMRADGRGSSGRAKRQRHAQARIVASFVETLIALDSRAMLIVLGDLNDTPGSKTLDVLKSAGLWNPFDELPKRTRYSRRHGGRPQLLDHVLVSSSLASFAQASVLHGNADAKPDDRGSDHDPVFVELAIGRSASVADADTSIQQAERKQIQAGHEREDDAIGRDNGDIRDT